MLLFLGYWKGSGAYRKIPEEDQPDNSYYHGTPDDNQGGEDTQDAVGISKNAVGVSQDAVRISHNAVGVSQDAVGVSQDAVGVSQDAVRISQNAVGVSQDAAGVYQDAVRISQNAVGVSQDAVRISQNAVGVSQDANEEIQDTEVNERSRSSLGLEEDEEDDNLSFDLQHSLDLSNETFERIERLCEESTAADNSEKNEKETEEQTRYVFGDE